MRMPHYTTVCRERVYAALCSYKSDNAVLRVENAELKEYNRIQAPLYQGLLDQLYEINGAIANAGMLIRFKEDGRLYITLPPMHIWESPHHCSDKCPAFSAMQEIDAARKKMKG
jgi:hypothetical protein